MEEFIQVKIGEDAFLYIRNEFLGTVGTTHEFNPEHCLLNKKTGEKINEKTFYRQIWGEDGLPLSSPNYGDLDEWYINFYGQLTPVRTILLCDKTQ